MSSFSATLMKNLFLTYCMAARKFDAMSIQPIRFTKDVVASYENTKTFLEGKATLAKIAKHRELFRNEPLYFTRTELKVHWVWGCLQDATRLIRKVLRIFLDVLHLIPCLRPYTLKIDEKLKIGFRGFGTFEETNTLALGPCTKKKQTPTISFKLHPKDVFTSMLEEKKSFLNGWGVTLLQPTMNAPQKGTEDLTEHPRIPITDRRLKRRLSDPDEKDFIFRKQGICRGMSHWFNYLYLQTRDLFEDPRAHMSALGKVFAKGGPREASLLQGLYIRKGKLLNLTEGEANGLGFAEPDQKISLEEDGGKREIANKALAEKQIASLKNGVYAVRFPVHQCSYIKVSESLSYFFDPNIGLLEFKGSNIGKKLLVFFFPGNYEDKGNSLKIKFYSMKMRKNATLQLNPKSLISS